MKPTKTALSLLLLLAGVAPLNAQISAFTYQGRLNLNGAPANGHYDFMFRLLNDPTNGVAAPVIPVALAVPASNGLFTTGMDFGAENFDGANRWLEISVCTNGSGSFTTLSPRQALTPTPYAVTANAASNLLGALPAGQISGTIPNASLPASPNFSGTVTASDFSGGGANLTGVNATTLGGMSGSDFWRTTGNANTTANTHFLGTTDNQPLELRVNGTRVMRVDPAIDSFYGFCPNVAVGSNSNRVSSEVYGATIGGGGSDNYLGFGHLISASFATIAGGVGNKIQAGSGGAAISGGQHNFIENNAANSVVAGGSQNRILFGADVSAISGGGGNTIQTNANYSIVCGGVENTIARFAYGSAIGGGSYNVVWDNAQHSTISGGHQNIVQTSAFRSTIAGGDQNRIEARADTSTIGGGDHNIVGNGAAKSTIGGGRFNTIGEDAGTSTIGGGDNNHITGLAGASMIGGGYENQIRASCSTIGGGNNNTVEDSAFWAMIGGGEYNTIHTNAEFGTLSGGAWNSLDVDADFAVIPGGYQNSAAGKFSFAAGLRAKALHTGAFVWADSAGSDFSSSTTNEFAIRATGGARVVSATDPGGVPSAGVLLAAGGGSWTTLSDRNAKENFGIADARAVLEKVATLPVQTWNYRSQDAGIRHIGPMAQDFKATFGVGESDTGIATVDADGVALAAIQGLNQKLEETRAENAELKKRLMELESRIESLREVGQQH